MRLLICTLLLTSSPTWADTPQQFIQRYSAEAASAQPGFSASAARGQAFAKRNWGVSEKLASCTACHGDNPNKGGAHVVTGKPIGPLSPAANPERFTDPAKVEKWFKRNCKEVVGRACSPAEKADFIQFVVKGNPS